jgi:hypothetical protein
VLSELTNGLIRWNPGCPDQKDGCQDVPLIGYISPLTLLRTLCLAPRSFQGPGDSILTFRGVATKFYVEDPNISFVVLGACVALGCAHHGHHMSLIPHCDTPSVTVQSYSAALVPMSNSNSNLFHFLFKPKCHLWRILEFLMQVVPSKFIFSKIMPRENFC